jgi:hypothetical protein
MEYKGIWHIHEMETWNEDYFNMEVQAYIEINPNGLGNFQFGLVSGQIDGEVIKDGDVERFEFSFEGMDELDPVSGGGWVKLKDEDNMEGRIKFHLGDSSMFLAKRLK